MVTQFSAMSGFFLVKSSVSFCMRIISPLLTVAIVSLVSAMAPDNKATAANAPRELVASNFMHFLRSSFESLKTLGDIFRRAMVVSICRALQAVRVGGSTRLEPWVQQLR